MKRTLFHIPTFFGLLLLALLIGCSNGSSNPIVPLSEFVKSGPGNPDTLPVIADTGNTDIGIMGGYNLTISSDAKSVELVPMRATTIGESWIVSGRSFFDTYPCTDCFRISGLGYETGKIVVKFSIQHPFPKGDPGQPATAKNRLDLDLFDLALVIAPKPLSPQRFILLSVYIPKYSVENPDGFTDELSNLIGSQIALPYVLVVDDSLTIPPSNTFNKFEMGSSREFEVKFPVQPGETLVFDLYLTFGYGASAVLANRLDPVYYNPEFNRKAAWKVEVTPPNGTNPPEEGNTWSDRDNTTEYNVTVKVYDWQIGANVDPNLINPTDIYAASNVDYVSVEIPGMTNTVKQVEGNSYIPGGTGMPDSPLVYIIQIANERSLRAGEYLGLVEVHDERETLNITEERDFLVHSPDGKTLIPKKIPGYRTYQTFTASIVQIRKIVVTEPSGGEHWNIGSNHDITWFSNGLTGNVTIDFSLDGGAHWLPIVSSPGTQNDGLYSWFVTEPESNQALIKVCSIETPVVCDASDTSFVIERAGNLVWAKRAGGTDNDCGNSITTLSDNSTVVIGIFDGPATFGQGEPNEIVLTGFGLFIARYNPDGTLSWVKKGGGGGYSPVGYSVVTLSGDSFVITGEFQGSPIFGYGETNQTVLTCAGIFDIFIAQYNPDGTLAWAKSAGGADWDSGRAVTALSDGSIVVTGNFGYEEGDSATFGQGETNETVLTSAGVSDIFVARYNSNGTLAWAKRAGGEVYDDGLAITTLSDNSTVVTGYFEDSATFAPGEVNETVLSSTGRWDVFIARYAQDGSLTWVKHAGGSNHDEGYGIATLSDNSIVVTGKFGGSGTFGLGEPDETVLTSAGSDDIFIARFNPDGTLIWAKQAGGTDWDGGYANTALTDNSTVVTGFFKDLATFGPGEENETVLSSAGEWDTFIARYNPDGMLEWARRAGGPSEDNGFNGGITTLSDDSTVVTGYFMDSATFGSGESGEIVLDSDGGTDIFIAKFAP